MRPSWWRVAFLAWTAFVWVGRIRNALGDPELDRGGRTGPLLLALSFLVPTAALAVGTVLEWRAARTPRPWVAPLLLALVVWTTVLWVVRAVDIATGGDHDPAFIAVHVVLAVVSIGLGALAVRGDRRSPRRSP